MSSVTINGKKYIGNNIVIFNGKIMIDGSNITSDEKVFNITVNGNIDSLKVDTCNKLEIIGNVSNINTVSGDVDINGDVSGSIQTVSGDVSCGNVGGSLNTISGDISYNKHL